LYELYYFNILKMCTRWDPINHSIWWLNLYMVLMMTCF